MKKSVSLLLSLLMVISIITSVPLTVSAASKSDLVFKLSKDGKSYYVYEGKGSLKGDLVIPSTYKNKPVTRISVAAFELCSGITSVTIPDSVISIGEAAFSECTGLKSITIGNGVKNIAEGAFYYCPRLKSITVDSGNQAYCADDNILFNKNKTTLVLWSAKKTDSTYTIPDSVTSIGAGAFIGCTNLESIKIPDSVKNIKYGAFAGCTNLESIKIPGSVTKIGGGVFGFCTGLKSITIGNGVTKIGEEAFSDCTSLKSVTIGNGVKNIGDEAFYNCENLKSITISNSIKSIGRGAFTDCKKLSKVNIDDIASWCKINFKNYKSNPLYFAKNLYINGELVKNIVVPGRVKKIGKYTFHNCTSLKSVTISNGVTKIGEEAFSDCTSLTTITIPDSVTSIGEYAFYKCTSLKSVTIGNGVTKIGRAAFFDCTSLEKIYWNAKNVSDFYSSKNVFYNAGTNGSGIKVVFGDSVERIPANAFKNVKAIKSITIPDSVKSIGYLAFYNTGYYNKANNWDESALYIGNHLIRARTSLKGDYRIKKGTKTIADKAFLNREKITSVTIPGSVKNIGKNAFRSCKSLTAITIPDNVKRIGYLAFYDTGYYNNRRNWDKSALYIGNHLIRGRHSLEGTYSVKQGTITIADMAFRDCDKLTSVKIHSSVKNVGKDIFYQCDNI